MKVLVEETWHIYEKVAVDEMPNQGLGVWKFYKMSFWLFENEMFKDIMSANVEYAEYWFVSFNDVILKWDKLIDVIDLHEDVNICRYINM